MAVVTPAESMTQGDLPFHVWVDGPEATAIAERLGHLGIGAVLWAQRAAYDDLTKETAR